MKRVMTKSMNAGVQRPSQGAIWHKSGACDADAPAPRADLSLVPPQPAPFPPTDAVARPSLGRAIGARLRHLPDRVIAASSLVSNDPVLDVRDFGWTAGLRCHWAAIRDEVRADPAAGADWRACPRLAAIVAAIPGLHDAHIARLAPGAHVPPRRGATKGLITCHLGLAVPRDGDARMRVKDRIVRWAEGETLVFDDTYVHEMWNETGGTRTVLVVQVVRPLRQPGRWIAESLLRLGQHDRPA